MADNPESLINDKELAWDIAYAQKPYIDVAFTARQVGLLGIAAEIDNRAETIRQRAEETAQAEGRMKLKLEERQAFSRLCDETEEDILTLNDFKISNPQAGAGAWQNLMELLAENPSSTIRFVEYTKGKHALVGDIAAAAKIVDEPTIASILTESAAIIAAIKMASMPSKS